ncbi:hypothetical protein HY417_01000 [Candidatus Kaiserbacteria bacterium]|nr:hypothetical protein [Candidatus Kaiserbacteria bacterium]
MNAAWRFWAPVTILLASPFSAHAAVSSLVWGDTHMLDSGSYAVELNTVAPTYVTGPEKNSEGEFIFGVIGQLYKIEENGRQLLESFNSFEDNKLFAWTESGQYELDILEIPPPTPFFIDAVREWLAALFFADIAHAQFGEPTLLTTIHFTIADANVTPDPVIIIPGILGSEQHNGEWVIDPILHTYDDLIATLDENGYTRDVDLFSFPYNWRKSNVETAVLLKEKIDHVKDMCDCDKVDLVAHSMGGLVARQYIQSDAYEGDVDQLIFLGTPHLGAPKAYLMWEGGEVGPIFPVSNSLLESILSHEAEERGYANLFDYIRNEPISAVQELLPVYDYIFDGSNLRDYPTNYPTNPFLEPLNSNVIELTNSGASIHNIVGSVPGQKTIVAIRATDPSQYFPAWEHGYPEDYYSFFGDHGLEYGDGDETVPLASATFIESDLLIAPNSHNTLPTETEGEIYRILTGKVAGTLRRDFDSVAEKLLHIKIFSPADLLVVDPDGKKIGKDLNGQEVNEILNAFYTGFGTDTEFIAILNPLDGKYKIYTQGTGSGPYSVETSFISNATTTDASFTGNTAPGITSQLNLEVSDGEISPESLDVVVTYESTLADLERIYQLKWVNVGIYKSLKAQLQRAKKAPAMVAKVLLQTMLKQLNAYRGKLLNEQGYQILKMDIEFLIDRY